MLKVVRGTIFCSMWLLMTWAHREGQRNKDMVWFDPTSYFRTRCISQGAEAYHNSFYEHEAIWKIRIRPVANADLDRKRVGIIREGRTGNIELTELAQFFSVLGDGTEEWQIRKRHQSVGGDTTPRGSARFMVWYQDGLGHTYYDDNDDRLYVAEY